MSTIEAMKIDAKLVKELRDKSGAPAGDCKKAECFNCLPVFAAPKPERENEREKSNR